MNVAIDHREPEVSGNCFRNHAARMRRVYGYGKGQSVEVLQALMSSADLVVDRVDDAWRALREYESDPAGLKPTSSITQYALLVTLASVFYPHLLLPLNPSYFINAK